MKKDEAMMKIPDDMLKDMQYENFHEGCKNIVEADDEDIQAMFKGRQCNINEVRRQYKKWLDLITPEEYVRQKQFYEVNIRINKAILLLNSESFIESLKIYQEALEIYESIIDKSNSDIIEQTLRIGVSTLYLKTGKADKAIPECTKVILSNY